MSPKEAVEIIEEPNWRDLWSALQHSDDGYEVLLTKWRKWNYVVVDGRKQLAPSVDGAIALARMGLYPKSNHPPGIFVEQHDDHMWLVTEGRAWRIVAIESKTMVLDSFGEPKQIDLTRVKWNRYCDGHAAVLEARR